MCVGVNVRELQRAVVFLSLYSFHVYKLPYYEKKRLRADTAVFKVKLEQGKYIYPSTANIVFPNEFTLKLVPIQRQFSV